MTDNMDGVIERLDRITSILSLAFSDQLAATAQQIRSNPVADALLNDAGDWIAAGVLQGRVKEATSKSKSTIKREIAQLVTIGALVTRGQGSAVEYRSTGVV
jgi:hypothetical protein